jgi:hypothetical protein
VIISDIVSNVKIRFGYLRPRVTTRVNAAFDIVKREFFSQLTIILIANNTIRRPGFAFSLAELRNH